MYQYDFAMVERGIGYFEGGFNLEDVLNNSWRLSRFMNEIFRWPELHYISRTMHCTIWFTTAMCYPVVSEIALKILIFCLFAFHIRNQRLGLT